MSIRAQNRLLAAFTALVVAAALWLAWTQPDRGPLIDTSERPAPTFTPATSGPAVLCEEC